MVNYFYIGICILPSIIAIAFIDWCLFRRHLQCEKCGVYAHWSTFILPTLLEIFLFIGGILIGVFIL